MSEEKALCGTLKSAAKVVVWSEEQTQVKRHLVHLSINGLRFTTQVDTKELAISLVLRLGAELGLG